MPTTAFYFPCPFWLASGREVTSSWIIGEAQGGDRPPDAHSDATSCTFKDRLAGLRGVGGVPGLPGAPNGLCSLCRSHYIRLKMLQTAQQHQAGLVPAEREEALRGE